MTENDDGDDDDVTDGVMETKIMERLLAVYDETEQDKIPAYRTVKRKLIEAFDERIFERFKRKIQDQMKFLEQRRETTKKTTSSSSSVSSSSVSDDPIAISKRFLKISVLEQKAAEIETKYVASARERAKEGVSKKERNRPMHRQDSLDRRRAYLLSHLKTLRAEYNRIQLDIDREWMEEEEMEEVEVATKEVVAVASSVPNFPPRTPTQIQATKSTPTRVWTERSETSRPSRERETNATYPAGPSSSSERQQDGPRATAHRRCRVLLSPATASIEGEVVLVFVRRTNDAVLDRYIIQRQVFRVGDTVASWSGSPGSTCFGWLEKRGKGYNKRNLYSFMSNMSNVFQGGGWRPRFFVLRNAEVTYYTSYQAARRDYYNDGKGSKEQGSFLISDVESVELKKSQDGTADEIVLHMKKSRVDRDFHLRHCVSPHAAAAADGASVASPAKKSTNTEDESKDDASEVTFLARINKYEVSSLRDWKGFIDQVRHELEEGKRMLASAPDGQVTWRHARPEWNARWNYRLKGKLLLLSCPKNAAVIERADSGDDALPSKTSSAAAVDSEIDEAEQHQAAMLCAKKAKRHIWLNKVTQYVYLPDTFELQLDQGKKSPDGEKPLCLHFHDAEGCARVVNVCKADKSVMGFEALDLDRTHPPWRTPKQKRSIDSAIFFPTDNKADSGTAAIEASHIINLNVSHHQDALMERAEQMLLRGKSKQWIRHMMIFEFDKTVYDSKKIEFKELVKLLNELRGAVEYARSKDGGLHAFRRRYDYERWCPCKRRERMQRFESTIRRLAELEMSAGGNARRYLPLGGPTWTKRVFVLSGPIAKDNDDDRLEGGLFLHCMHDLRDIRGRGGSKNDGATASRTPLSSSPSRFRMRKQMSAPVLLPSTSASRMMSRSTTMTTVKKASSATSPEAASSSSSGPTEMASYECRHTHRDWSVDLSLCSVELDEAQRILRLQSHTLVNDMDHGRCDVRFPNKETWDAWLSEFESCSAYDRPRSLKLSRDSSVEKIICELSSDGSRRPYHQLVTSPLKPVRSTTRPTFVDEIADDDDDSNVDNASRYKTTNAVTLDDDDLDAEEQQYRRTMVERARSAKEPASDLKRMLTAMIVESVYVQRRTERMRSYLPPSKQDFLEKRELSLCRDWISETFDDPRSHFVDHMPTVFATIRRNFGMTDEDFLRSFSQPLTGGTEGDGKSKQIFFFTADRRFILKSFPAFEVAKLRDIMPTYFCHMLRNPSTLLCRFYALLEFKDKGYYQTHHKLKECTFVVMNNIGHSDSAPIRTKRAFDLKGSTYNRIVPLAQFLKGKTGKDKNWTDSKRKIRIGDPSLRKKLVKQLRADAKMLFEKNIIDYSLYVEVGTLDKVRKRKMEEETEGNDDGSDGAVRVRYDGPRSYWKLYHGGIKSRDLTDDERKWNDAYEIADSGEAAASSTVVNEEEEKEEEGASSKADTTSATKTHVASSARSRSPVRRRLSHQIAERRPMGDPIRRHYEGFDPSADHEIYWLGIIDILQPFNFKKTAEHYLKRVIVENPTAMSAVPPQDYYERFCRFLEEQIV